MIDYLMHKLWQLKPYVEVFTSDWLYYTLVIIFPIVMVWVVCTAIIDVYRWRKENEDHQG